MAQVEKVNAKKVTGRRDVHYHSFADLLADAQRMAERPTRTLGNWSVGQIYKHLSYSLGVMLDGSSFSFPRPVQFLGRWLVMKRMLTRPMQPGFRLPRRASNMIPPETSTEEGLLLLQQSVERLQRTPTRAPHPGFGVIRREDWDEFQLRHCEMHMSFIVDASGADTGRQSGALQGGRG